MENGTCASASTISLNLNRTVWLFILLSNKTLCIFLSGGYSSGNIINCLFISGTCFIFWSDELSELSPSLSLQRLPKSVSHYQTFSLVKTPFSPDRTEFHRTGKISSFSCSGCFQPRATGTGSCFDLKHETFETWVTYVSHVSKSHFCFRWKKATKQLCDSESCSRFTWKTCAPDYIFYQRSL